MKVDMENYQFVFICRILLLIAKILAHSIPIDSHRELFNDVITKNSIELNKIK